MSTCADLDRWVDVDLGIDWYRPRCRYGYRLVLTWVGGWVGIDLGRWVGGY